MLNNYYIKSLKDEIKKKINKIENIDRIIIEENHLNDIYSTKNILLSYPKYNFNTNIKNYIPHIKEIIPNTIKCLESEQKNQKLSFVNLNNIENIPLYNKIYILIYNINVELEPFCIFYMIKYNNVYNFPEIIINDDIKISRSLLIKKHIKEKFNINNIYIYGVKIINNNYYIIIEDLDIKNAYNLKINCDDIHGLLLYEIINEKTSLNIKIDNKVYDFFINNISYFTLNHINEQPIIAYQLISNNLELNVYYTLDNLKKILINNNNIKEINRVALFLGYTNYANNNIVINCNSQLYYNKLLNISFITSSNKKVILTKHNPSIFL